MKVSRINTGIYQITKEGRIFQARKNEVHGQWDMFEMVETEMHGEIWLQTFVDFKSCKVAISDHWEEFNL